MHKGFPGEALAFLWAFMYNYTHGRHYYAYAYWLAIRQINTEAGYDVD